MGKLGKKAYTRKHFTDASNKIIKNMRGDITSIFERTYGLTDDKRFRSYVKEDPILTMLVLGDGQNDKIMYREEDDVYKSERYRMLLIQYVRGDNVQRKISRSPGDPGHLNLVVTTTVGNSSEDIYAPMSLKGKIGLVDGLNKIEEKVRSSPEAHKRIL